MTKGLKVLVLDDEPIVGKRLKPALSKLGCEVETFTDPVEAFARIEEKEFDIVITDILMGEIDGIQVLDHAVHRWPRCKVIMITGYAMMHMARQAMEKGAFDFIAKPFNPDDLRAIVSRAAEALGLALDPASQENGD